jgi:hypothetical protein
VPAFRETNSIRERFTPQEVRDIPYGISRSVYSANSGRPLYKLSPNVHAKISYMSGVSLRQATDPDHCVHKPMVLSASAYGSTSSTRLECLWSISWGSERQSVMNIEPRQSETTNSLLVAGLELIAASGWGNAMTYAVGCGLSIGEEVTVCGADRAGDGALDEMSTVGCRSHTINILSSKDR